MKSENKLLHPVTVAAAGTLFFAAGFFLGLIYIGYFAQHLSGEQAAERLAAKRMKVQLQKLQKTLMEMDQKGQEFRKRTQDMDEREARIRKMESDLQLERKAQDKIMEQIAKMRQELDAHLILVDANQSAALDQMTKLYGSMAPANAAALLYDLPEAQAVQIMSRMKQATAVKILEIWVGQGEVQRQRANRITQLMRVTFKAPQAAP